MQRNKAFIRVGVIIVTVILIAAAGIAIGYGFGTSVQVAAKGTTLTTVVSPSNSSEPYVLTLVITTGNFYNSTFGDQPAYYVLGPNGTLQSSAKIVVPAHRTIELVIVNYDDGSANLTMPLDATVTGTVNDQMTVVNNTEVNSTMISSGIQIRGSETVSNLQPDVISHTFTIDSLGLNVPVATLSTEVAYFTVGSPGVYTWFCMTACGGGANGLEAAMSTPGWMTGSLVVQ